MSTRKMRRIAEGMSYRSLCLQEVEPIRARYHLVGRYPRHRRKHSIANDASPPVLNLCCPNWFVTPHSCCHIFSAKSCLEPLLTFEEREYVIASLATRGSWTRLTLTWVTWHSWWGKEKFLQEGNSKPCGSSSSQTLLLLESKIGYNCFVYLWLYSPIIIII